MYPCTQNELHISAKLVSRYSALSRSEICKQINKPLNFTPHSTHAHTLITGFHSKK